MASWFGATTPTTVFFFLYPNGSLFGHTPPASQPLLFHGPVGMNNDVSVSPSRETDVTHEVRDFNRPILRDVPGRNIPAVADESYQIVAELRRVGPVDVPVYHRGQQPVLEVGVRFEDHVGKLSAEDVESWTLDVVTPTEHVFGQYGPESIRDGVLFFPRSYS